METKEITKPIKATSSSEPVGPGAAVSALWQNSLARPLIPPGASDHAVRVIALAVAVLGLFNLWSSLLARGPGRATWLNHTVHLPLVVEHASRTLIALFGLALLMLARSLARHKRQAWWIALILTITAPLPHLAKGLDYEEALICLVIAATLIVYRHSFYAANDRPSSRQGLTAAIGMFAFAFVYGPVGYYLLREKFRPEFTWDRAIRQTTHQLFYTPPVRSLAARTPRARWFDESLLTISVFSFAYGGFMLLRPVFPRDRHSTQERDHARRLLEEFGSAPIGYFTLLPDKRYLFERSSERFETASWGIAYVVMGSTAVALGDPFGDPARADAAVTEFVAHCRAHDWQPAFYQVSGRHIEAYRAARLRCLKVGEDALIDLSSWSLKGKAFQDIRTAINKMGRIGVVLEEFDPEATDAADCLSQMDLISEAWLRSQKGEEKTFALGSFEPDSAAFTDGRVLMARETETGRILAFVTFVPIYGPVESLEPSRDKVQGWGLDLMRRLSETPNGLMEFLIASAALRFQTEGAHWISLGLSPLSDANESEDASESDVVGRGRQLLYERFNYFYAFKGLHAFKEKFGPSWEPRYMIYPGDTVLAQTVYAVIRAHSPQRGLLTFIMR